MQRNARTSTGRPTGAARRWWLTIAMGIGLAAGLSGPSPAAAAVIYDNLNGGVYKNVVWAARYTNSACANSVECWQTAQDFEIGADFVLTSISMPLGVNKGDLNEVRLSLYAANGAVPGSVIESWTVSNQMAEFDPYPVFQPVVTVASVVKPVLLKGLTYFVAYDRPTVSDAFVYSAASAVTETRTMARSVDHGLTWLPYPTGGDDGFMAMKIEGDLVPEPVPEPGSMLLLGSGLVALVRRIRRVR